MLGQLGLFKNKNTGVVANKRKEKRCLLLTSLHHLHMFECSGVCPLCKSRPSYHLDFLCSYYTARSFRLRNWGRFLPCPNLSCLCPTACLSQSQSSLDDCQGFVIPHLGPRRCSPAGKILLKYLRLWFHIDRVLAAYHHHK